MEVKNNFSINVLDSKNIVVIKEFDCLPLSVQVGEGAVKFVIGQTVKMIVQCGNMVNFQWASDYFSAPSHYFVTEAHWRDIQQSIIDKKHARISQIK